MIRRSSFVLSVSLLIAAVAAPVSAERPEEFYKGRQLTAVVPSSSGGSFDQYMRLMAEHLGRFIPGKPTIIVQNMPGGGGVKSLNYLYNAAPKDGSFFGMPIHTTLTFGLLNPEKVKFDGPGFNWIGSMAGINDVIGVWHTSSVKNVDDARKTVVPMGATGRGGNTFLDPVMANNLLGTRFKVITGYPGAAEINVAIERGELMGRASSWEGLSATQPDWISGRKFVSLIDIGPSKIAELEGVPRFADLLTDPGDKVVLELLSVGLTLGRALFTTPGVPPERVAVLRKAFDAMVVDGAYLADAKARAMTAHDPKPGAELQGIVAETYKAPKAVIARAKDALTPKK